MAQSEILGLFGGQSPAQIRDSYLNSNMVSPAQMGSQGLLQQVVSMGGNAGAMIGSGINRLTGTQVPGEREAMAVDQAMQDSSDPSMTQAQRMRRMSEILAQQPGMGRQAMLASQEAVKLEKQGYEMQGFENAEKAKKAVADVLANNPNATSQELYAAAAPFSSDPESIIKVVAGKEDKAAALQVKQEEFAAKAQSRLEEIKLRGQYQQEVAAMNGATREEVARIGAESRAQQSAMMGQIRVDIAKENIAVKRELAAAKRNTGVLAPSLQKEEGKDLESIDNFDAMTTVLNGAVNALTPNDKGVTALSLSYGARAAYAVANITGRSTPESRAYSDLQASIAQAVNIKTDAARGVQTDGDVLRFANALIEISGRYDVKATREALIKFQDAARVAGEKTKVRVNSRRQAQNVGSYFTDVATPEGTAPKGSGGAGKATRRYNRDTKTFEVITGG